MDCFAWCILIIRFNRVFVENVLDKFYFICYSYYQWFCIMAMIDYCMLGMVNLRRAEI